MLSNTQTGYRIDVFLKRKRIGTGLRISRSVAFMAAHCFKKSELTIGLRLRVKDGPVAEVTDFNHASDLVLLTLDDSGAPLGGWAFGNKCRRGDPWRAVSHTDPKPLSGYVLDPRAIYHEEPDLTVKALRLQCERPINKRAPYAGSPIEPHGRTSSTVLGLMVRPWKAPLSDDQAFAISVKEAMALFGLLRPSGTSRHSNHTSTQGDPRSRHMLGVWWTGLRRRPPNGRMP